jgi:hypothetical protein
MLKHIFALVLFALVVSPGVALECEDGDEKFVKIDGNQIGYNMYDTNTYADKLKKCEFRFECGLYTGGDWGKTNAKQHEFNVVGGSRCFDSDEYSVDKSTYGSYCFCNIKQLDNFKVLSSWVYIKQFQKYVFDETKFSDSEQKAKREKERVNSQNLEDCMNNCASACQSNMSKLIKKVQGFYTCGTALYKKTNVKCVADNKFINAKKISVFDDVAEIITEQSNIVFTKGDNDIYVGEYDDDTIYLKVKNNKIYVGNNTYSMEECL